MMEFYNESKHVSQKERMCELCFNKINVGEEYWSERGKYEGIFFTRALHNKCHDIEVECRNIIEDELDYEDIMDYIENKYCNKCKKQEDCQIKMFECHKILKHY